MIDFTLIFQTRRPADATAQKWRCVRSRNLILKRYSLFIIAEIFPESTFKKTVGDDSNPPVYGNNSGTNIISTMNQSFLFTAENLHYDVHYTVMICPARNLGAREGLVKNRPV
jgi:hypothetical protein